MNKIVACLFLVILFGCSGFNSSNERYKLSKKELISDEILRKSAAHLKKESGLKLCGTGGQMMHQIKMLALSFDYKGEIQIDEARQLLIKSVDTLVSAVNADEQIRPYLNNYPFEPKNVEIRIFLRGSDHWDVPPGELSVVSALGGTFNYKIDNPKTKLFTTILNETYAEAKEKTRMLSSNCL